MSKEKWLEIRDMNEVPPEVWYEYYEERGGTHPFDVFWNAFQIAISRGLTAINTFPQKHVSLQTALNNLYKYYNKKYEI